MGSVYHNYGNADINKFLPNALGAPGFVLVGGFVSGTSSLVFADNDSNTAFFGYTIELDAAPFSGGFTGIVTAQALTQVTLFHGDTLTGQIIDRIDDIGFAGVLGFPVNSGLSGLYQVLMGPLGGAYVASDTGDTYASYLVGNASANRMDGGSGKNYFEGGPGADQMNGGAGSDTFRLYKDDFQPGEIIKGNLLSVFDGAGVHDTVEVKLGTHPGEAPVADLSTGNLDGIEVLRYIPTFINNAWIGNQVILSGDEALNHGAASSGPLAIWGSVSTDDHTTAVAIDSLTIRNNGSTNDFSHMAFTAWQDGIDTITILSAGSVTGTIKSDIIDLTTAVGTGVTARGSDGDDIFIVGASLTDALITGDNGSDTLKVRSANIHLSDPGGAPTLTTEKLVYDTGNSTVTVTNGADIALGSFHFVTGSAGTDTLVVLAAASHTVDLSSMVFSTWTDGTDVIRIDGQGSDDTLTGSSQADTIRGFAGLDTLNGKGGADTLTGGTYADKFVFDAVALTDAQNGIVDHVTDYDQSGGAFNAGEGDQIDLSSILSAAYSHGSGQTVGSLVRFVAAVGGVDLQVDTDGLVGGTTWTTIAHLDGLSAGNTVNVILDATMQAGSTISVTQAAIPKPAFRFFDSATGDHFYTLSAAEANQIRATLPTYHDEGAPWSTPDTGPNTTDVFRFFDVATGTHFLTSSVAERDQVLATLPSYHFEGIAFEAYNAPSTGTLTLERFFNTVSHLHTYAASPAEIASILSGGAGAGWVDEGAGFIVHT